MAITLSPAVRRILASGAVSAAVLGGVFVAEQEGVSLTAYEDAGKVWTICYGYTHGVKPGDTATPEECAALLKTEFGRTLQFVASKLQDVPMSPGRHVALASFCYNVGYGACGGSTLFRRLRAEDPKACDELLRWKYVTKAGVRFDCSTNPICRGVYTRRLHERELCQSH
jgi:lysozyme